MNEFGGGTVQVGSMVLTHPERFVRWEQLHTDCAGDEFSPDADGQFDCAPYLSFVGGKVEFDAGGFSDPNERYGSVSFLLPQ